MVNSEFVIGGIGLLSTLITGWSSWFFTRRKYNSEVDSNLIENIKKGLDFYENLCDDNARRLEELLKRNEDLSNEVNNLNQKVSVLTATVMEYKRSNEELREELNKYTSETTKQRAPKPRRKKDDSHS